MTEITLNEEIENHITNTFLTTEQKAFRILRDIQFRIDKKIKLCDQEMENSEHIALNDCLGCIESKKKAFQEVLEMLNKK